MEIIFTEIAGCFEIIPKIFTDHRGKFIKPYHIDELKSNGIDLNVKEEYYSVSHKNVIRGLHFQTPPKAVAKLVTCITGKVLDAVVDLRKNSKTYLKTYIVELTEENSKLLYIPEGLAHGFCSLQDNSLLLYMCSEMHSPENDSGIHWNSAGIKWPVKNPVVSDKDEALVSMGQFNNPF